MSAAASGVLASFYGDETSFTVTSAGLPGVTRQFMSFSSSVLQIEDARMATLGGQVADYVTTKLMQPLHGREGDREKD